jgi:hypothetical protein
VPDSVLQFGTSLGDLIDPETSEQLSPKVTGEFTFQVRDPALFASRAQAMGGEPKIAGGTQAAVAAYLKEAIVGAFDRGTPYRAIDGKMTELAAGVATRINAELAEIGAGIQFGAVKLTLSPEDQARLAVDYSEAARGAPGRPPAGAPGVPGNGKGMLIGVIVGGLVAVLLVLMIVVHFMHRSAPSTEHPADHQKHGKH